MDQARHDPIHHSLRTTAWIVVIVAASLGFSLSFACATPFAALAAVAGAQLGRRQAIGAVLLAWAGNQSIGYFVHHYPRTWDSFAWGGGIGLGGLLAVVGAGLVASAPMRSVARVAATFVVAFATYEMTLFMAAFVLPSEGNAFAPWIVIRILEVNVVAYSGLLVLHRLAIGAGVLSSDAKGRLAAARL